MPHTSFVLVRTPLLRMWHINVPFIFAPPPPPQGSKSKRKKSDLPVFSQASDNCEEPQGLTLSTPVRAYHCMESFSMHPYLLGYGGSFTNQPQISIVQGLSYLLHLIHIFYYFVVYSVIFYKSKRNPLRITMILRGIILFRC